MTTENMDNGSATTLGFTSYGRPVEILGRLISAEITFDPPAIDAPPSVATNVCDLYGADGLPIATNLKSRNFAVSAALRWSRMLGQPVTILRRCGAGVVDGANVYVCREDSVIRAHEMSDENFAQETLLSEIKRLGDAVDSIREIEMDARAVREDAEAALLNIKQLADIEGVALSSVAEVARSAADRFDTTAWCVLVAPDDADMLGEMTTS